ncbi:hypothetical protein ACTGZP_08580 [Streptococcus suis]
MILIGIIKGIKMANAVKIALIDSCLTEFLDDRVNWDIRHLSFYWFDYKIMTTRQTGGLNKGCKPTSPASA